VSVAINILFPFEHSVFKADKKLGDFFAIGTRTEQAYLTSLCAFTNGAPNDFVLKGDEA
jgi:hypothetical protein